MTQDVSIPVAFLFGLLSFVSPCVLPLVPSYISFVTGISFEELTGEDGSRRLRKIILVNSLMFILGFSTVFGILGSFLIGVGFAAGWTPCIGPILATILMIAASYDTLLQGVLLLVVYSLGLAVPFFLTSLGINTFLKHFNRLKRHMRVVSIVTGSFLIVTGLLIYFNYFAIFTGYVNSLFA